MKRVLIGLFLLLFLLPASIVGVGFMAVDEHWKYDKVWASGRVRDEAGDPVSGATVFGVASWYDGHGLAEQVFRSVADRTGAYEVEGPSDLGPFGFSLAVFVTAPGHAPAWGWYQIKRVGGEWKNLHVEEERVGLAQVMAWLKGLVQSRSPDCVSDIVLSTQPAGLEVVVLGEGGRVADLPVTAYLEEDELSPRRIWERDADARQLADALSPIVMTGQDGVARFEHLLPGRYHIRVADAVRCERAGDCGNAAHPQAWGAADGVAVSRGDVPRIEVALSPRNTPPQDRPHYAAAGVLGVSPDDGDVMRFTRPPESGSAAARITVFDAAGRPMRATVELVQRKTQQGTTGPDGVIQFTGLPPGHSVVSVAMPDVPAVDFGDCTTPLPSADRLRGRTEVLSKAMVLSNDRRASLLLRAQPVGYVRGTLRQPAGQNATAARTSLHYDWMSQPGATLRYCPSTGEFVVGPFAAGSVLFRAINGWDGFGLPETCATAEIEPGQVTELEFTAPPVSAAQPTADGQISDAFLLGSDHLAAQVFLADGVTPAWGARMFYYVPVLADPVVFALTDARGEAHMQNLAPGHPAFSLDDDVPLPRSPVVVGLIPGSTGAVIMPVPTTPGGVLRMVLPAPIAAHGQVTIGGLAPTSHTGTIRILAIYQGKGHLKWPLSMEVTTDPEGRFVLSGLTSGRYLVQARLDDVWLSPAATMEVGDTDPDPLALDMPVPSALVLLHVVDRDGHPVIGAAIDVDRAASGPPPDPWISDDAGLISFPRLGAGSHVLRSVDSGTTMTLAVPPLPASALDVTMTLSRAEGSGPG